jgi:hypothetical protein
VFGDYATGPVAYLNLVEGFRRDITLYSVKGLLFDTRLFRAHGIDPAERDSAIDALITSGGGPVFYTPTLPHRYGDVDYGLYYKVVPDRPPTVSGAVLAPRIRSFLERVLDRGPPRDPSQQLHYREFTLHYCRLLATLVEHGSGAAAPLAASLDARCGDYQGLLQRAEAALRGDRPDPERALQYLSRAAERADEAVTTDNRAALHLLQGRAQLLLGDRERASVHFARSISIWPSQENPALQFAPDPDGGVGQ